jgi:hypothetical protein
MKSGPELRAIVNRKLVLTGESAINETRTGVMLFGGVAQYSDLTTSCDVIKAGKPVTITTVCTVKSIDRVVLVRANPEFYKYGTVTNLMTVLTPKVEQHITFNFKPYTEFKLSELKYIAELFIGE